MSSERSSSSSDTYAYRDQFAWQTAYPRNKPLVEYCTNEWQHNSKYAAPKYPSNLEHEIFFDAVEDYLEGCLAIIKAPRFRRLMLALVILISTSLLLWLKIIGPWLAEERATLASLNKYASESSGSLFGANVRPQFPGMIQLARMDPKHLPSDTHPGKRLIFVGDIHGCKKELLALMDKVAFNPEADHLVAVGDVINKGPDSPGVIDFLRANNASCVRGNHEDTLLLMANDVKSSGLRSGNGKGHHIGKPLEEDPLTKLIRELSHDQLAWLRALPVILEIGHVEGTGHIVAVHGGLVPGIPLEAQDPVSVMNMRTIDLATHVPSKLSEHRGGIPWFRLWNRYQKLLPKHPSWKDLVGKHPNKDKDRHTLVVYGHDAKRGLQIEKYTKGLDSRCAKGGKLTALVISSDGKQQIQQVNCQSYYTKPAAKQESLEDILRPAGG